MSLSKTNISFSILKEIKAEVDNWQNISLNDVKDKDVYEIIDLLRLFLEIKGGKNG